MQTPSATPTRENLKIPLYRAVLEPQRSTSVRNINLAIVIFALVSLPLCAMFTAIGAWPVAIFIAIDVVLLFAALRLHFWFGRDREVISITHDAFSVERVPAWGRKKTWSIDTHWLKVEIFEVSEGTNRLYVGTKEERAEIGRFLTADEKVHLAVELRERLERMWTIRHENA